jgi:hypothetical protein
MGCKNETYKQLDMRGIPFLIVLLLAIGSVYAWTVTKDYDRLPAEGFQSMKATASPNSTVTVTTSVTTTPSPEVKPQPLPGKEPTVKASGALPAAPYGVVADTAPSMYTDPDSIPVTLKDLQTVSADFKGFMQFEMPGLLAQSDPTIQLPLSSAKADYQRVQSEVTVMERNPGQPSTIKGRELKGMADNLNYLRDKYRRFSFNKVQGTKTAAVKASEVQTGPGAQERATFQDLKDARIRMIAERTRLASGGSLDPVITARVAAINNMIQDLSGIIQKVQSKMLLEQEIPIYKSELSNIFRTIGDTNAPVPGFKTSALPAGLKNLLPPDATKTPEDQALIRGLMDKYAGDILKGVSVEFEGKVKYTSENEARAGGAIGDNNTFNAFFGPAATAQDATKARVSMLGTQNDGSPTDDMLKSTSDSGQMMPEPTPGDVTDPYAFYPQDGQRTPLVASGFDWRKRSKEICENARRSGLNPTDFGCMPEGTQVSPTFSWRGYARMICNRLQTNFYTGTAEACGCPPLNWPGWKSAAGETAL